MTALVHGLARLLRWSGQLALAFTVISISYDVVMRYFFKAPTLWSLEVNGFLVLFLALIPAADVERERQHLHIGCFTDRCGPRVNAAFDAFAGLLGTGFAAVLAWKGLEAARMALQYGDRVSSPLGTPLAIPYAFIPVGFGLLGLQCLVNLAGAIRRLSTTPAGPEQAPRTR